MDNWCVKPGLKTHDIVRGGVERAGPVDAGRGSRERRKARREEDNVWTRGSVECCRQQPVEFVAGSIGVLVVVVAVVVVVVAVAVGALG